RISKIFGRLSGSVRPPECLFLVRRVLSQSQQIVHGADELSKSAERLRRKRVRRPCRLRIGGDGVYPKRLCDGASALSSVRHEIKRRRGSAFCPLLRSALSRSARSQG